MQVCEENLSFVSKTYSDGRGSLTFSYHFSLLGRRVPALHDCGSCLLIFFIVKPFQARRSFTINTYGRARQGRDPSGHHRTRFSSFFISFGTLMIISASLTSFLHEIAYKTD